MKNKLIILFLSTILVLATLTSCTYIPTVDADVITMITVDADAKVEFMVNPKNTVVSATPLNDIASIIMVGESLTGKKPDEAASEFISLAAAAGLVSKNGLSTVKISVSGDSDYVDVITDVISKKIVKSMKKSGIKGSVEVVSPMTRAEIIALCLENGYITENDAENFSDNRLMYALATKRVSYNSLPTQKTKDFYDTCGSLNYNVWIKDETLVDLAAKKDSFPQIYAAYNSAVSAYKVAVEDFEEFYVSSYFDVDSAYQKALSAVRDAKEALISGGGSEEALRQADLTLSVIDTSIKAELKILLKSLDSRLALIDEVETEFDDQKELGSYLKLTYGDRVQRISKKIDSFTSDFNKKFEKELKFITDALSARKDSLMK